VSAVACGQPLSLAQIPPAGVVRLSGLTDEQLAVSLDPLPPTAPAVIRYRPLAHPVSALAVVDDALDKLETIARDLFPSWLPDVDGITGDSDFDRRVMRELAGRKASASAHFGPFLADVAEAALCGCRAERRYSPEVRASGLAGIIADSYGRDRLVLLIGASPGDETDQRRVATACEWMTNHGRIGVWLTPGALPAADRFPTVALPVPGFVDALVPAEITKAPSPAVEYPALAGVPHPASACEQALERTLARCEWAAGRTWNQEYASHSLAPPIRVDLMWPKERCVVEIDGPDHRGALKYAADRRRDNGLQLDGFAVLRFTNDEIDDDPQRVLADIEKLLTSKRHNEGNLV
jgi:very-short-patch-repair endonuclease